MAGGHLAAAPSLPSSFQEFYLPDPPEPKPLAHARRSSRRQFAFAVKHHDVQVARTADAVKGAQVQAVRTISTMAVLPKVEQQLALTFRTPQGRPVANVEVGIDVLNKSNVVAQHKDIRTDSGGKATLTLSSFPVVLKPTIKSDEWALVNPEKALVALQGTEGRLVASLAEPVLYASIEPAYVGGLDLYQKQQKNKKPTSPAKQQSRVKRYAYSLPDIQLERVVADYDIVSEPGTTISMGDNTLGVADTNGHLTWKTPLYGVKDGATLLLHREHEGASFDAAMPIAPPDPYSVNIVKAPALVLSSVSTMNIEGFAYPAEGLPIATILERNYGKAVKDPLPSPPKDKKKANDPLYIEGDGSSWWRYANKGLNFRVRQVLTGPGKNGLKDVVEAVQLTSPAAGSVGGVSVGMTVDEATAKLGPGKHEASLKNGFTTEYLDGGLAMRDDGTKIVSIEIRRPGALIKNGVDMTMAPTPTRIFVDPIAVHGEFEEFPDAPNLAQRWLSNMPGLQVVDDRSQSDYVLHVDLDQFNEKRGELAGLVPTEVTTKITLRYRLIDVATDKVALDFENRPIEGIMVEGSANANYNRQARDGAVLLGLAAGTSFFIKDATLRNLILLGLGVTAVAAEENMKRTMSRAAERTRVLALRDAVQQILAKVSDTDELRVRVIGVMPKEGRVRINAGRKAGITPGTEFAIYNGKLEAFDSEENPLYWKQTIARVVKLDDESSTCEVYQVERKVDRRANEVENEVRQYRSLLGILDPSTGMVCARRILRIAD